jgi:hypothetical protein
LPQFHGIGERPDFYIVPSKTVADFCSSTHKQWVAERKADGSHHKDSSMRLFEDKDGKYKEKWGLLGLELGMPHSTAMSSFMDRMSDFEPKVITPCHTCRHRISGLTCKAFPQQIPLEILDGRNLHRQPYPGDHGIQYLGREQVPETPK